MPSVMLVQVLIYCKDTLLFMNVLFDRTLASKLTHFAIFLHVLYILVLEKEKF